MEEVGRGLEGTMPLALLNLHLDTLSQQSDLVSSGLCVECRFFGVAHPYYFCFRSLESLSCTPGLEDYKTNNVELEN